MNGIGTLIFCGRKQRHDDETGYIVSCFCYYYNYHNYYNDNGDEPTTTTTEGEVFDAGGH